MHPAHKLWLSFCLSLCSLAGFHSNQVVCFLAIYNSAKEQLSDGLTFPKCLEGQAWPCSSVAVTQYQILTRREGFSAEKGVRNRSFYLCHRFLTVTMKWDIEGHQGRMASLQSFPPAKTGNGFTKESKQQFLKHTALFLSYNSSKTGSSWEDRRRMMRTWTISLSSCVIPDRSWQTSQPQFPHLWKKCGGSLASLLR